MQNLKPAEITESVYQEIRTYFDGKIKIDRFAAAKISKKINTIPNNRDKEFLKIWLLTIQKNESGFLEAYKSFSRRLQIVDASEFHNIYSMLSSFGRNTEATNTLHTGIKKTVSPKLLASGIANSIINLSLSKYEYCYKELHKLKKLELLKEPTYSLATFEQEILKKFSLDGHISEEQLSKIGEIVFQVADHYKFPLRANRINYNYEQNWLSVVYVTDTEFTPATILEMNDNLIDELITNDLDILPLIIQFKKVCNVDDFYDMEVKKAHNVN